MQTRTPGGVVCKGAYARCTVMKVRTMYSNRIAGDSGVPGVCMLTWPMRWSCCCFSMLNAMSLIPCWLPSFRGTFFAERIANTDPGNSFHASEHASPNRNSEIVVAVPPFLRSLIFHTLNEPPPCDRFVVLLSTRTPKVIHAGGGGVGKVNSRGTASRR